MTTSDDTKNKPEGGNFFPVLLENPEESQRIIHALTLGKHVDPTMIDAFNFLQDHQSEWEQYFRWSGYRLRYVKVGSLSESYYYLSANHEEIRTALLSRGGTTLGLILEAHFLEMAPGDQAAGVSARDLFEKLMGLYDFNTLCRVFQATRRQKDLTEDNKLRLLHQVRKFLQELARYRFIELKPNKRSAWDQLRIYRLPALNRFLEIAELAYGRDDGGDIQSLVEESLWYLGEEGEGLEGAEEAAPHGDDLADDDTEDPEDAEGPDNAEGPDAPSPTGARPERDGSATTGATNPKPATGSAGDTALPDPSIPASSGAKQDTEPADEGVGGERTPEAPSEKQRKKADASKGDRR